MSHKLALFLSLVFTFISLTQYAAPAPPPPAAPPGFALPGVIILLLAALGFGAYKHFNNHKK